MRISGVILVPMTTLEALLERTGNSIVRYPNGWEVDWAIRRRVGTNSRVWARFQLSYQERARDWHWVSHGALAGRGIEWVDSRPLGNGFTSSSGYKVKTLRTMTPAERDTADKFDLWIGKARGQRRGVLEHRLVAAIKYGSLPDGIVVRHLNGDKTDNRPENLLPGTQRDNVRDHRSDRILMMYWRERALLAEGRDPVASLKGAL